MKPIGKINWVLQQSEYSKKYHRYQYRIGKAYVVPNDLAKKVIEKTEIIFNQEDENRFLAKFKELIRKNIILENGNPVCKLVENKEDMVLVNILLKNYLSDSIEKEMLDATTKKIANSISDRVSLVIDGYLRRKKVQGQK